MMERLRYGAVVRSVQPPFTYLHGIFYRFGLSDLSDETKEKLIRSINCKKIGCYAQNDKVISVMTNIDIIKRQKYNDIIGL